MINDVAKRNFVIPALKFVFFFEEHFKLFGKKTSKYTGLTE